jgi:hypothetical protein
MTSLTILVLLAMGPLALALAIWAAPAVASLVGGLLLIYAGCGAPFHAPSNLIKACWLLIPRLMAGGMMKSKVGME